VLALKKRAAMTLENPNILAGRPQTDPLAKGPVWTVFTKPLHRTGPMLKTKRNVFSSED